MLITRVYNVRQIRPFDLISLIEENYLLLISVMVISLDYMVVPRSNK